MKDLAHNAESRVPPERHSADTGRPISMRSVADGDGDAENATGAPLLAHNADSAPAQSAEYERAERVAGRVRDKVCDEFGTAFGPDHRGRYRVAWDRMTPHEHKVRVDIPSRFFEWAEGEA